MTGEYRYFIKVHNGFPEHRKTAELSDRAFRRLIEAWCFCSRNLNDGKLTNTQVSQLFSPKVRDELVLVGYLEQRESDWYMHDYLVHQMSAQDVADLRSKRAAAGRRGGKAKAEHLASASTLPKQNASKPVADIDVDIDVDIDEEQKTTTELPSSAELMPRQPSFMFEEFWKHYPRKVGKADAQRAWDRARRRVNPGTIQAAAERMAVDPNLPDAHFIPHASTWLNRDGWDDAPYPPRNQPPKESTTDQRVTQGLSMAQRYAEQEAREEQQRLEIAQ